jgi:ABC-2 type transport system ATP-binding protein
MIKITDVKFGYKKKNPLFENLNLELIPGNIYGLLGKNGAGKTTLLKLISGLLFTDSGKISIDDQDVKRRSSQLLSDMFFMPEELYSPELSIGLYHNLFSGFYPRFNHDHFSKYLSDFELEESEVISSLSYGQRKKMHIAFGLASNTKIVLFDEPTNGLDIPSKSAFRKIISEAALDERLVIISTHQIRDVNNLIDPLIIIDKGEIILNSDIYSISEKITIEYQAGEPAGREVYFHQKTPQGYAVVKENKTGTVQDIDLEILFNAVINDHKIRGVIG